MISQSLKIVDNTIMGVWWKAKKKDNDAVFQSSEKKGVCSIANSFREAIFFSLNWKSKYPGASYFAKKFGRNLIHSPSSIMLLEGPISHPVNTKKLIKNFNLKSYQNS